MSDLYNDHSYYGWLRTRIVQSNRNADYLDWYRRSYTGENGELVTRENLGAHDLARCIGFMEGLLGFRNVWVGACIRELLDV